MLKKFLILILSTSLLFSCGKENKKEVIFEPDNEEIGKNLYAEGVQALKDGDPIHGLILGSGISHGGKAASLSAPKKSEQARLLNQVWASAAIDPSELDCL